MTRLLCRTWDRGAHRAPVLLVVLMLSCLIGGPLRAQDPELGLISGHEAWELLQDAELVIVDVRTQTEWRETGVAPGAARISFYNIWAVPNDAFVEEVLAALDGDRDRPVALICATGGRSSKAARQLRESGFSHVADIAEGMQGSQAGIGWLSRALPIEHCGDCETF